MTIAKLLGIVFRTLVIPVTLIAVVIGVLKYADITVPLERVRQAFVSTASDITGRDVHIEGEVRLAISFYPTLVVDRIHIANEPGWSKEELLTVDEARVQLALMPILKGKLKFLEISAEGIILNLEQDQEGNKSWGQRALEEAPTTTQDVPPSTNNPLGENFTIKEFSLTDFTINYYDARLDNGFSDRIERLQINTEDHARLTASLSGETEGIPYSFTATSNLLRNLVNKKPWHFESNGVVNGHPVSLVADLDTHTGSLLGDVALTASNVNIGKLLDWLHITEGLELATNEMKLSASLNGSSLHEIVHQSTFRIDLTDGKWILRSHVDDRFQTVTFRHAAAEAVESQDLKILFDGKIGNEPLELEFRSNPLGAFFGGVDKVKLALDAKLARAELNIDGDVTLPISSKTFSVNLAVKGDKLDQWNDLLASDMPPFGPYSLSGQVDMSPKGFTVSHLDSRIGDSDLGGTIKIDITRKRPLWKLDLVSNNFQIDDFDIEEYSVIPDAEKTAKQETDNTSTRERVREVLMQADSSIHESHPADALDADIRLSAKQVYSGADRLGHGTLLMTAREHRTEISDLSLSIPGGDLKASMAVELVQEGVSGYFKLDVEKLDYGILARRIKPDTPADGLVTAHVDLKLSGEDFSHSLQHADGKIDFAAWPRNIGSDILNIWAVNVFLAILPSFSDQESRVNCVVAVLNTNDGQLKEQFLALDSTKVWVNGNLEVSFPEETVRLSMFPRSKTARMFSLQTPVHVRGTFDELSLRIRPLDLIGTYASFILSPLHAPMRRIFGEQIPEDGSEICGQLLDRDYLQSLQEQEEERRRALDNAYSGD